MTIIANQKLVLPSMTAAIARFHQVCLVTAASCQVAASFQIEPADLGCRLLLYTSAVAIYYACREAYMHT